MPKDRFGEEEAGGRKHRGGGWLAHFAGLGLHHEGGGKHFGHFGHRIFDHGDLRYVILGLIAGKPSYGYELIKTIEEKLGGAYAPSPGIVYPTLTMLEEMGFAAVGTGEGGKKLYSITPPGRAFLEANKAILDSIFARMQQAARLHRRSQAPAILRGIQNLKFSMKLKTANGNLSDEQIKKIADALDEAAKKIEQC